MKEKLKNKKYLLGYVLRFVGLSSFTAYGVNFQNGIICTFQIGFSDGLYFRTTPDYNIMYAALAVNCIMVLLSAAVLIYGFIFIRKNKYKENDRHKSLRFLIKSIASIIVSALVLVVFILDYFIVTMVVCDQLPTEKLTAAVTDTKITSASTDGNIFMIDTVTMYKESDTITGHDMIKRRFDYDNSSYEIINHTTYKSDDYSWVDDTNADDFVSDDKITVNKSGHYLRDYYIDCNRMINNKMPFMQLYKNVDYSFMWKTESISHSFELLPEYFIYAKEFGSYTHIEKYADFDYKTNYTPVTVPAGAKRKMVKGSSACVKTGADDYNGINLFDYVYDREYRISQIDGDRAVITFDGETVAAMNTSDLYFATEVY